MQALFAIPSDRPLSSVDALIGKAERCFRLARRLGDDTIARSLIGLGEEYVAQATALGADPLDLPRPPEGYRP